MLVSRIITFVYLIATNDLTIATVNIILHTSKQNEVSTMDNYCHVSNQIAAHCDERETYCEICGSTMTQELGNDFLECDQCEHKQYLEE